MKKIIVTALLVAVVSSFTNSNVLADATRTSGLYTYDIKGNGTLTITDFDWDNNDGDVYIPSMLDGYNVTAIGESAFAENDINSEVSIVIPETITIIGQSAFENTSIITINIPSSVKDIGKGAFSNCQKMTQIIVDPSNDKYASINGALYEKQSKKLIAWPIANKINIGDIPSGIVEIGDYALKGSDTPRWDSVLPDTVTRIGIGAFEESYFGSPLPESVTVIPEKTFYNVVRVIQAFHSQVTEIGDYACAASGSRGEPYEGTAPGESAIPSSVVSVGNYAFYNRPICATQGEGALGKTVDGYIAFGNEAQSIGDYAFACDYKTSMLHDFLGLVLSGSISEMGEGAFSNRPLLKQVLFEDGYNAIVSDKMFLNCEQLEKVSFEGSISEIGSEAFSGCTKLYDFSLPSSLNVIGANAFAGCNALTELVIPSSVTEIGANAFEKSRIVLIVEKSSYAELWAQENGYSYKYFGEEAVDNLDWLNGDDIGAAESEDTGWLNN